MNIVHSIPRFPYFGNDTIIGGAASALLNLAREQSNAHAITIISEMPGIDFPSRLNPASLSFMPLTIHCPASSIGFGLEYTARIVLESYKCRGMFQVVHGHSGYLDYVIATVTMARVMGAPAVHTLYCPVTLESNDHGYPGRLALQRFALRQVDLFIAISKNVARSLSRMGIRGRQVRVIPPAVNIQRFCASYDREQMRNRFGIPADTRVVLFVGNTKRVKNMETVLAAMSLVVQRIPECLLVVTTELGHSSRRAREALLSRQIEDLGLGQHVMKLGIIPNMPELMVASDVLVSPFLNTDGPSDYFLAVLEAMAVGRPVIVSSVGGMPEVVDDEVGYLVEPEDFERIGDIIVELLQNPDRRIEMGRAASSRVRRLFNPKLVANQVQAAYNKVLHQ